MVAVAMKNGRKKASNRMGQSLRKQMETFRVQKSAAPRQVPAFQIPPWRRPAVGPCCGPFLGGRMRIVLLALLVVAGSARPITLEELLAKNRPARGGRTPHALQALPLAPPVPFSA